MYSGIYLVCVQQQRRTTSLPVVDATPSAKCYLVPGTAKGNIVRETATGFPYNTGGRNLICHCHDKGTQHTEQHHTKQVGGSLLSFVALTWLWYVVRMMNNIVCHVSHAVGFDLFACCAFTDNSMWLYEHEYRQPATLWLLLQI